jgi:hypothetical protein
MLASPRADKNERGAVLIAGMFGIMVLLAMGALVVDILRMERIGRSLQRAADAAALAASLQLKGDPYTPAGTPRDWKEARRAAVLALRSNLIAEDTNVLAGGGTWEPRGIMDFYELETTMDGVMNPYRGSEIRVGRLIITIERGAWLYDEDSSSGGNVDGEPNGPYFVPLESDTGDCPEFCMNNNYEYANAARIRIQMTSMRSFFPLAWAGTSEVGGLTRESIGSVQKTTP